MSGTPAERNARRLLAAIIVALMAGGLAYRGLVLNQLEHTSLVFVGIPALLAIATLYVRPRSAIGTVNKVVAIALCMSAVVFGESLVCILMAAPIFFCVGSLVGAIIAGFQKSNRPRSGRSVGWRASVGVALIPLSVEGVVPAFEFDRDEVVAVTVLVDATPAEVREQLARPPQFARELPPFLKLGFPVPTHASGAGLEIGAERRVRLSHGEHHSGELVMTVSAGDSSSVTFTATEDSSYITHWLDWHDATVTWREHEPGRTTVTWTLRYRRRLDPAIYFAPLERYGVSLAAEYLARTLTTPDTRR